MKVKSPPRLVESRRRSQSRLHINWLVIATTLMSLIHGVFPATVAVALGGSYTIKPYAADPTPNHGPYLPTYAKQGPSQLVCPTPSGGTGRASNPLANAVAYQSPFQPNNLDAVTSLAPQDMALGQVVPFEIEITVKGSTAPENGKIQYTMRWDTRNNSTNFGFDPAYQVYCAFVDPADAGTNDPGNNAKVDSWASSIINPGANSEKIEGTFKMSGLDNGDNVIVEVWVVLKSTIPPNPTGNISANFISASTLPLPGDSIGGGNQALPMNQLGLFYTASADIAISKADSPDPVVVGQALNYTINVTNTSTTVVANGVVVTDTLDANTSYVSASGASCSLVSGKVICNVGALSPLQSATINIVTTVNLNAPTAGTVQTGTCTVGATGVDLCNQVEVKAINADTNTANNTDSEPTNATAGPAISLSKTPSPSTYNAVGQVINYTYLIQNTGNVPLTGPFAVSDDKATVTCVQPASLAVGATVSCSASYTISQTDLNNGSVTNKATATAKFNTSTVTSTEAKATVTADQRKALTLDKTASPAIYNAIGDVVSYDYLVTNSGNVALAGTLSVSDDKVSVTCSPSSVSLAPGASTHCSASHTITQADLDAGSITNKATASIGSTNSNEDTASVSAKQSAKLSLDKTASPGTYEQVGATIAYQYVLKNDGNVTLVEPFDVVDNKTNVTCPSTPTSLAPGESITCSASYSIVQADLDAGSVTNEAQASAKFGNDTVLSDPDQATVTATAKPSLHLTKAATTQTYAAVDQEVTYQYTVKNDGNVTLAGPFSIADDKLGTFACPAVPGSLAPQQSVVCSATHKITQADLDAGSIKNDAVVSNGNVTSNHAQETVTANQKPSITLFKSSPTNNYDEVGDQIHYDYLITNNGNVTINGPFTVSDDKASVTCPGTPASLGPLDTITCTATYVVTQADLDSGSVTNKATAKAGALSSNESTVTVGGVQSISLSLKKTANHSTYDAVGQVIEYTYVLENTGNVTLKAPYTVNDDKTTVTCSSTDDLAPKATTTCTASYTITQADLDGGSVKNTATGHANFGAKVIDSNEDKVTVVAITKTGLTLVKAASPKNYSKVGDTLSYVYTLMNTGNVTLNGPFAVTDDKVTVTCSPATSLAPNVTLECTASYVVTQADLDAGNVTNTAKASANNGNVESNQTDATVPALQDKILTLQKSATPTAYDKVDAAITYSYVFLNEGNVTLAAPFTVNDDELGALTCPTAPATLVPGGTFTCEATYHIPQADLDAGFVTNEAMAHAAFGSSTVDSNKAYETITAEQKPALLLDKKGVESSYDQVGDGLNYVYVVTNIGNVTLHDPITVDDDKGLDVNCPDLLLDGLAPGSVTTCFAFSLVTQNDLDVGSVTNKATAKSGTTLSNPDEVTIPATQSPALKLTKTADPTKYKSLNQLIDYTYVVENTGNVTLNPPFTVSDDKATVTCPTPASLAPGATITCHASYVISQADLDAGSVTNHAQAQGYFGGNAVQSVEVQVTVTAEQTRALSLVKSATELSYASAGDEIHYKYLVTNVGNVTLHDPITIDDDKATATCDALPVGGLAPDGVLECAATYQVTQADLDNGEITNVATAASGNTESPSDTVTVKATQKPELTLTKSAGPTPYNGTGDVVNYSYALKNTGNVTLNGPFTVSDNKISVTCPDSPSSLAPDASTTCTASYTIKQKDLDAGSITNIATGAAQFDGKAVTSAPDTATVFANQTASLTLVKKTTSTGFDKPGQSIAYLYDVTNNGNVTLDGPISVSDNKVTVSCPPNTSSLAPGETVQCTASYSVQQADVDAGKVTNDATAHALFQSKTIDSNDDQVTVTADQKALLSLTKTADPMTYDAVGQTINYSYKLKNDGNVTLSGPFTVSDDKVTVTCPPDTSLPPGGELTCSASYTIAQSDLDSGSVTNIAAAHGTFKSTPVNSDDATITVNAVANKKLSLTKTATTLIYKKAGDTVSYVYVVKNIGNVTLNGALLVSDDKTVVTCDVPNANSVSLAPDAEINCSASYVVSQADVDFGSVTNTAQASIGVTASNEAQAKVEAEQNPNLVVAKTANVEIYDHVGQVINYSYKVSNAGNVTLIGPFSVQDDKLGSVTCPAGNLAPGTSMICTASYTIAQSDLDAGSVDNVASASNGTVSSEKVSLSIPAAQKPDLTLDKQGDPSTYTSVGQTIEYKYILKNVGNVTLSPPYAVSDNKVTVTCPSTPAALAPNASVTCTASYAVKQSDIDNGEITNYAVASAHFGTDEVGSNWDDVTVTAGREPAISLSKTATPKTFSAVGTKIDYTYAIKNVGNVTLPGPFQLSDDKLGLITCPTGSLAPTLSITCTASYVVTQADLNGAPIKNTATASTLYSTQSVVSNDAVETVSPQQSPSLQLTKTAKPAVYSAVGQTIVYTYVVSNAGNVTLIGPFMINDDKLGTFQCGSVTTLAPGASVTCTKSYVITASDLNSLGNGSITNIATASGKFGAATVNSNQAQATVRQQSTTGQLTPTQTTCGDFANGSALDLTQLLYLAKNGSIVSVAEGVLFYYTIIVAPSANFKADIVQTNTKGFPALEVQQESKQAQVLLFDSNCVRSNKISGVDVKPDTVTKKQTINFSVSGATPGQIFYLSVKYSVKSLPGTTVSQPLPTVPYSFITNIGGSPVLTSQDSLLLRPKTGSQPTPTNPGLYLPMLQK